MLTYSHVSSGFAYVLSNIFPFHMLFLFQHKIRIEVVNNDYSFEVPHVLYTQCKGLSFFKTLQGAFKYS